MHTSEWKDHHEHKYHLTEEEDRQEKNDDAIKKYFEGTLKPSRKQIIKKLKEGITL